ncbi:MAG TPA: XTP/dITP diphosphatase [Spirochaetota bacterium]|nr:XTP/dITP diphosphatase [Spirochaetota bacterium]
MKLLIATKNTNKVREIRDKLARLPGLEILSLEDTGGIPDVVEDGDTFAENAAIKALAVAATTGFTSLADDSGLIVDALDGAPGIYSARFGGSGLSDAERCLLLLEKMTAVPKGSRSARFVCAIAIARPGTVIHTAEGVCEGSIIREMRGGMGFGYDPVFLVEGTKKTMAELSMKEKNSLSHRARALEAAALFIRKLAAGTDKNHHT